MAKLVLQNITSGYSSIVNLNANFDAIEEAIENTLSRDGTSPNDMDASLDMGGFQVKNLAAPTNDNDAVRLVDVANIVAGGDVNISPTVAWATGITGIPSTVDNIGDLVDPNADRLVFWDDSAGALVYLTLGTGLSITGTTISSSASSVAWAGITGVPAFVTSLGLLTDPNADRIVFWDDSASNLAHLTAGTGLSISGTSISVSILGLQNLADPNADRIYFWDDSAGLSTFLSLGSGLAITGTTLDLSGSLASFAGLVDPNADRIVFWDDSAATHVYLEPTGHLSIAGTQLSYSSIEDSFTGTLTGVTGSVTGSVKYSVNDNVVTVQLPDLTGTSNSTAHTITGAPAGIAPATAQRVMGVTTNNSVDAFGVLQVETSGTITLHNVLSATFAGTGTEGAKAWTFTYHRS
jgi:hypothetical protein